MSHIRVFAVVARRRRIGGMLAASRAQMLVVMLLLSVVAGCGMPVPPAASLPDQPIAAMAPTAPPAATAQPTAAPASEPVTIRVFAPQDTTLYASYDLATNSFTKEIEAKLQVHFDWQLTTFDSPSARQKRQISLASGDYPDLYLLIPWVDQFSQAELLQYGRQGVIVPLNELIEQYAPHTKAALEKYPYFKAMATAPDGKIYGIPQLIECYHCSYANKLWINSKWLKKLNLSVPKTTDEFKAVLEAFKTKDPNGNGKADEVPLSGSIEEFGVRLIPYLMNGFIYDDDRTYLLLKDGKVDLAANKPEWKEGLSYIKSLVDAHLIDPGAFTQNAGALKQIGDNPDAELLGASAGMHPSIFVTTGTNSKYGSDYDAIPPLQGPHAAYATYNYPSVAGATFVLTNKAGTEAQIAAVKLLDYFFTQDGQIRATYGEEGKDWRKPQAGDVAIEQGATPLFAEILPKPGEPPHNTSWEAISQYFQPKAFRDGWVQATDIYASEGYERRLQEATHLYDSKQPKEVFPHWAVWIDLAVADEVTTLRTSLNEYIEQNALLFVTGIKDLDRDWDAYVHGLDRLGLARYLTLMQQAYDASAKP
jgi:putative aldouronate transport system substrate-binding protein